VALEGNLQNMAKNQQAAAPTKKRVYFKQSDVPMATLDEALRIPRAIHDNYAGQPTSR
jgi:hypothetical protein